MLLLMVLLNRLAVFLEFARIKPAALILVTYEFEFGYTRVFTCITHSSGVCGGGWKFMLFLMHICTFSFYHWK